MKCCGVQMVRIIAPEFLNGKPKLGASPGWACCRCGEVIREPPRPRNKALTFYGDKLRHLVCVPYTIENLHKMAEVLGIKRCWFHGGKYAHYDIPKRRIKEILAKVNVISPRELLEICKG